MALFLILLLFFITPSTVFAAEEPAFTGWVTEGAELYRYENGERLGAASDVEFCDPETGYWYYLDAARGGAARRSCDVYLNSYAGKYAGNADGTGKWVRYDSEGRRVSGWNMAKENWYYFDPETGAMLKGFHIIDGYLCYFEEIKGWLDQPAAVNLASLKCFAVLFILAGIFFLLLYLCKKYRLTSAKPFLQAGAGICLAALSAAAVYFCVQIQTGRILSISSHLDQYPGQYCSNDADGGAAEKYLPGWQMLDGSWYYFEQGTGKPLKGTHIIDSRICWLDPISGRLEQASLRIGDLLNIALLLFVLAALCAAAYFLLNLKSGFALAAFIGLHVLLAGILGFQKNYLFTDEVFSYGLANCEKYTFVDIESDPHWVDGVFFENYLKYDASNGFSLKAAYENQVRDVHPPVYYFLLHIVSFFFQDMVYSPIPGILLNLIILVFIDLALYYISAFFLSSKRLALLAAAFWGLSAAGLSNIMYIRMYLLTTLQILLYTAYHIYLFQNPKRQNARSLPGLAALIVFGGLTQYYFYFFAALFSGLICFILLFRKRIREMFAYGFTLLSGLIFNFLFFPATLHHIFGYRGADTLKGLSGGPGEKLEKLCRYASWINASQLGGFGMVFLWTVLVVFLFRMIDGFRKSGKEEPKKGGRLLLTAAVTADIGYFCLSVMGAELVSIRYIYPFFPLLAVTVLWFLNRFFYKLGVRYKDIFTAFLCVLMTAGSLIRYGIDWTYETWDMFGVEQQLESLEGADCIFLCRRGLFNDVYAAIDAFRRMDEVRITYEDELSRIPEYLAERKSDGEVIICFPWVTTWYTDDDLTGMLETIASQAGYSGYELVYAYDYLMYRLLS